jgi:hypothetical protein
VGQAEQLDCVILADEMNSGQAAYSDQMHLGLVVHSGLAVHSRLCLVAQLDQAWHLDQA